VYTDTEVTQKLKSKLPEALDSIKLPFYILCTNELIYLYLSIYLLHLFGLAYT